MQQVGAIATGHRESARAGAEVLADGGNAIDAAAAAAIAACTCEPTLTGLGGAGFATVHIAGGADHAFDFFAAVPGIGQKVELAGQPVPVDVLFGATTQTFHVGPQSCAVPGFAKGVLHMHERFGRLPLSRVCEPGINLARRGIKLPPQQAYCHHLLTPILTRTEKGRATFAPAGPMLVAGDHFAQPHLADTIELLAREGESAMYRGELAAQIVEWSRNNGGLLSAADLEHYQVVEHEPVRGRWRNFDFVTPPPPSSGGVLIAFAMRIIERALDDGEAFDLDSPRGAQLLVSAQIATNNIRGSEFDRHLYGGGLAEWVLSDEMLARGDELLKSALSDTPKPSSRLGSTTQLSVIDAEGNAVSMTTSTGCGSGEFVGDTGIHMNNMMGEEDLVPVEHVLHSGERLTSMMAPSLLLADNVPVLAIGSAGSNRLRGAIVQTLLRVMESRQVRGPEESLQTRLYDAVQAPRLHAEAGSVQVEPGYVQDAVDALHEAGHDLNHWPGTNMFFGGSNLVALDTDKSFAAAGDHRRGGGAFRAMADGTVEEA